MTELPNAAGTNGRVLECAPLGEAWLDCSPKGCPKEAVPSAGDACGAWCPGHVVLSPACRPPGCAAVKMHAPLHPGDSDVKARP